MAYESTSYKLKLYITAEPVEFISGHVEFNTNFGI